MGGDNNLMSEMNEISEIRQLTLTELEEVRKSPRARSCATCVKRPKCTTFAAYSKRYLNLRVGTDEDAAFLGIELAHQVICDQWQSMFITYPITVSSITVEQMNCDQVDVGRPAIIVLGKINNYDDLPHVAVYLGQLPLSIVSAYTKENETLTNRLLLNPCLLVPRYNKLFYGMNSQWSFATKSSIHTVAQEDKELPIYRWAIDHIKVYGDNNGKTHLRI